MLTESTSADSPESPGDSLGSITTTTTGKTAQRPGGRRTHRACDRCRVKKSKCNGQQPCNTCKANERTCVFSTLRRRDIRKWHCRIQDTVDEAIQRLYRACKESSSFPGILPEERDGFVSTEQILQGMGFSNLDLGPGSAGTQGAGPSVMFPLRTHLPNLQIDHDIPSATHSEGYTHHQRGGETGSAHTAMTMGSPHSQSDICGFTMMHDSYQQRCEIQPSPTVPLNMSDQFLQAVGGHPDIHNTNLHYAQTQHQRFSYPTSPQHPMYDKCQEHTASQPSNSGRPGPTGNSVQTQLPLEYRDPFSIPQYQVWDGASFVSPQRVWPMQHEIQMAAQ